MAFIWCARLCIILFTSASFVLSEQEIYVSRLNGNDTKTCGKLNSPCRTISYGIQKVISGSYIYLDGSATTRNPYTCGALDQKRPGIRLNKSVSFVGIRSRAYISCLHGNPWLVDGTKVIDGVRISLSGLTFLNTFLRLFDASVTAKNTVFAETKLASLDIYMVNLPRLDLSLENVVFQQNTACLTIKPRKGSKIFVTITNALFYQNGNFSSDIPSILWLNSIENLINIQMRNCSFEKNTFKKYGMIAIVNQLGTTFFSLNQFRMEENKNTSPHIVNFHGVIFIASSWVFMTLEHGFVYKTSATFLSLSGVSAQINISNIQVDRFYSLAAGGGVTNLFQFDLCYLSIKNSSFCNGKNGAGGVLSIIANNSEIILQNSTIQNTTGRVTVFVQSAQNRNFQSTNHSKKLSVYLRIINCSFSDTVGGVVYIFADNLAATIVDSVFLRNVATEFRVLAMITNDATKINLQSVCFLENSSDKIGIIEARAPKKSSTFDLSMTNVTFVHNKIQACSQDLILTGGIVFLSVLSAKINVVLKNTRFIENSVKFGSIVLLNLSPSTLSFVTLDTCIFRENIGHTVFEKGRVALVCKHSIFDSNTLILCRTAIIILKLIHSTLFFKNTTFVNNSCAGLTVFFSGTTNLSIYDSAFVRNKHIGGTGGALAIDFQKFNQTNSGSGIMRAFITRVLFQENIAATGSVLFVTSSMVALTNCTFLNNFASFQGGQIVSSARGSVELYIVQSVFNQTIQKIVIPNYTQEFMVTSFLRLYNSGTLFVYNTTFNRDTKSNEPLILVSKAYRVLLDNATISNCPVGHVVEKTSYSYFGNNDRPVTSLALSCKACDYNFYSLQRGTARGLNVDHSFKCTSCPRGADCVPAIRSKSNFWGYQISSNPPKLAFTICPFGYCKSPPANSRNYNDCQGKRTGVMCGDCSQGYTEALWSTYCTPVKDCHDHWFWVLFLALVFSMGILLVFKPPFVTYSLKQIFWFKRFARSRTANIQANRDIIRSLLVNEENGQENIPLSSTEQLRQDKRQFSRFVEIIFYFYQIAQLLLSSSSLTEFFDTQFLVPVLGFFNFQPSFKKQGFLCPFPGLTPKTKLGFKIAPVFGTLVAIFVIYALHFFISRMKSSIRPAISPYLQASIKTIFLGYVTMATVSISLIRCVVVAGEARWFYNGNILCYQWWQYAAKTFNAIFVIPFIFVLAWISFKLYHDKITIQEFLLAIICPLPFLMLWMLRFVCPSPVGNVDESPQLNALKEMLLAPYRQPKGRSKRGALYWQSVLIARRFILVLIFCVVTEPSIRLFCMTLICVFVLCCHLAVRPFQNSLANNLETLSLLFLVILSLVNLFKSVFVGSEENIKGSLVTVFKAFQWLEIVMLGLFPAILLLLVCFAIISVFFRVLFIIFRSIFKCLFRPCSRRWFSRDSSNLLNVCDNNDDE